ncbi:MULTISPECIES: hemin-degrading factor [unclassified Janthinobacterium]|uniref:hemin-degrading factor n=1 Tax=unclassified Janthinobacterium TaxID=2610881 RepID=UPI00160DA069|nr:MULTISPECIES: ChuX/HutX family heme-like substrate-binding protein [unclassified Janthinobacterium]MBB5369426.1 putative hemin transport protein [Janthinobacterium sp. K2C7]MBB5381038.1 putative hemin transport protein [Janthinobacterium sp. K2Li3]MBB5387809.1 putative hemin transport protein [Janthinobacterium sp. K2E3]
MPSPSELTPRSTDSIAGEFARLRREKKARHRDIATELNISEGELIAAHAGLSLADGALLGAERLQADWPAIIAALEPLGEVMALTRNVSCVHEKTGVYRNASHNHHVGLVLGGDIDLRVFYRQWVHGFAVSELTEKVGDKEVQRSLQFFDAAGHAVHKIFLKPQSDLAAYEALVTRFADDDQEPGIAVTAPAPAPVELPDAQIDVAGFRAAWADLRDTHEFFTLLKKYSVSRLQGLRLAEARFVQQLDKACVLDLLNDAARENVSIMAFVGNAGMIQIHSGPVQKIAVMGPWINILDARFNLHLREDHVASAWVVRKPTVDGLVTSVELFDEKGDTIVMFFGERKPGAHELCEWRNIVEKAQQEYELCAA